MSAWLLGTGALVWLAVMVLLSRWLWSALTRRRRTDVRGRWIAVTGCDSGFGRGVVGALATREAEVIALCFTPEGAEAALAAGARRAPVLDLRDPDAIDAVAREIAQACGGELWGLVHNAGVVRPGFVDYLPMSFYRQVMEVNFFAPVRLTRRLLDCLRQAHGRVVFVSSVDGLVSLPGNAPYDASKFALEAYADALRVELSFWDVGVSVVNPSTMRTPMAMGFFDAHRDAWNEMERTEPGAWQSLYSREWLERYIEANRPGLDRIAQDPSITVNDLVHALSAKRPRQRYLSGTLAKTLFYALWVGPEHWSTRFKRATVQPPPVESSAGRGRGLLVGLGLLAALVAVLAYVRVSTQPDPEAMQVSGMLHVNINCSDFERSRAFYEQLGFRVMMEVPEHSPPGVAEAVGFESYQLRGALMVHADGSVIDLLEWRDPRDDAPPYERLNHLGLARIALTTTDIEGDVARLRANGVEFLTETPALVEGPLGNSHFICFKDPDGTIVELVQIDGVMGAMQELANG